MLFARMSPGVEVTRACLDVVECGLFLFPPACTLDQVDIGVSTVVIRLRMRAAGSACPTCGHRAHQVQSRYTRHLADVSCLGKSVHFIVLVRRFWCRHPDCPRRIFAERLGPLAEVYARRTTRLREQLRILGFACGAALVLGWLDILHCPPVLQRSCACCAAHLCPRRPRRPRCWAWMIFPGAAGCAMARSCAIWNTGVPVAVLPECSVATFAGWLEQHPGVEIISRDRGGIYAEGARRGAPAAEQVADRWHLLKNLGDALERYLIREQHVLFTGDMVASPSTPMPTTSSAPVDLVSPGMSRRKRRLEQVLALQTAGKSVRAIARELGLARNTVRKYLRYGVRDHTTGLVLRVSSESA